MSWADGEFIVFDLEANADRSDPPAHEIIEIGAVLVCDGVEVDAFATLVRPTRRLRDFTCELTGLTDEELAAAPVPAAALHDFYRFVRGRPMVAHNGLRYDFPLLDSAGARAEVPAPEVVRLDTLELAHLAFPRAGKGIVRDVDGSRPPAGRSLDELAHYLLGVRALSLHRALDDSRLLLRVLPPLLRRVGGSGPARRLQRWVLGAGRHPWAGLLAEESEPVPLEDVVPEPAGLRRRPAIGGLDPRDVAAMFADGGALMGHARQPRRQQMEMALRTVETLQAGGSLLIEAPTGTGKTLAYLVPAIEHARASGSTVVVAPHSKVLQDQVMSTLESLSEEVESFVWVLVKGRSNYVDLESLAGELDALAEDPGAFTPDGALALAMVCGWVAQTATGDWDDLRVGALEGGRTALSDLRRVLSRQDATGPSISALDRLDFYRRAREGMRNAHVAVLNHALVVSDHEWIRHSRHLVLDEAHNLEDAATDALTEAVSRDDLAALCDALWDPRRRSGTVRRLSDAAGRTVWPLPAQPPRSRGGQARTGRTRRRSHRRARAVGDRRREADRNRSHLLRDGPAQLGVGTAPLAGVGGRNPLRGVGVARVGGAHLGDAASGWELRLHDRQPRARFRSDVRSGKPIPLDRRQPPATADRLPAGAPQPAHGGVQGLRRGRDPQAADAHRREGAGPYGGARSVGVRARPRPADPRRRGHTAALAGRRCGSLPSGADEGGDGHQPRRAPLVLGGCGHPRRGSQPVDDREGPLRLARGSRGRRPHGGHRDAREGSLRRISGSAGGAALRPGCREAHTHRRGPGRHRGARQPPLPGGSLP